MQRLRYKDFEIEEPKSSFQAEMFMQMAGEIHQLKSEVSELRKIVLEKEIKSNADQIKTEEEARAILKVGEKNFNKILKSENHKKPKFITNAKNMKFFHIDDLVEYASYLFSEDFSHNEYFMNPEFYEKQGVNSAHKNFERYKKNNY